MKPYDLTASRFFVGPTRRPIAGPAEPVNAKPPTCTLSDYKAQWCGRYLGDGCYCARDRAPGSDWCQQCAAVLGSQA